MILLIGVSRHIIRRVRDISQDGVLRSFLLASKEGLVDRLLAYDSIMRRVKIYLPISIPSFIEHRSNASR